ncbi:MAG: DUF2156 domain-containing protein [Syntrophales bacterium]
MDLTPIKPDDYPRLKKFFTRQPYKLSSYSLASIIAWSNCIFEAQYEIVDDVLIVANECRCRPQDRYLLLPISPDKRFRPAELRDLAMRLGFTRYCFVPDDYVKEYREEVKTWFDIELQPGFAEYLYFTEDLTQLKGNRYVGKRNRINRFVREYVEPGRVKIERICPENVPACLAFLEEWCSYFPCTPDQNESLFCEKQAAIASLTYIELFDLNGILIRIDDSVRAFAIGSHLSSEVGVLSFEKALAGVKGLYQFLDRECASRLFAGYIYINKESDMGLPGLAQSKESYHPVMKVNSYCLHLRQNTKRTG